MVNVNFVSNLAEVIWRRQELSSNQISWRYTETPEDADLYVVFGITEPIFFPNPFAPRIFCIPEPPEVFEYNIEILAEYDQVLSGDFWYLKSLRNHIVHTGLLNWSVGIVGTGRNAIESKTIAQVSDLSSNEREQKVSVVTSLKTVTPFQKTRIQFLEYLDKHMNEIAIFGHGISSIEDKADALLKYSHHLAIENSLHPSFWTEKLSDPILTCTPTFYVGHMSTVREFGERLSPILILIVLTILIARYKRV